MVKIVVPESIRAIAVLLRRADQFRFLLLVFRDDNDGPAGSLRARLPRQRSDDMIVRFVVDVLCGIEPQAVEMKFTDPIACVVNEELPYGLAAPIIEIDRL